MLGLAIILLVANGFFVAAEFALVKVRVSRVEQMVVTKRFFSKTALWLAKRLEQTLSACQLGITMASLALGWVGEPAVAALIEPLFTLVGVDNETVIHTVSFIIGFTLITALHLVVGEQAPKIFAIRQPETMLLWCALPMKFFYIMTYPLMVALNASTAWILGLVGMKEAGEHEVPYTEEEIRALLSEAHIHGNLTKSEANLLDAVFEFDDMVCRRIMLPRGEAEIIDINIPVTESMELIRRTKHSRYPVCDGSLDSVLGVLHVKDLIGRAIDDDFDFQSLMRPPKKVPESMQISTLLRHFRGTHQLMAFVLDEHGTVVGIVTLENVLEEIIGDVADEFDTEAPQIVPQGPGIFVVDGATPVEDVEEALGVSFETTEQDTMSGLLMHYAQRIVHPGDIIALTVEDCPVAEAKVLEASDDRTTRLRITKVEVSND
ncbi:MAG: hemolysin family protein [Planctomycetota bacterium]